MASYVTTGNDPGSNKFHTNDPSPAEEYIKLIETPGKVDPSTLDNIFDQLLSVAPEQLLGEWNGGFFDTGHPVANTLKDIHWVGKSFKSTDDVDPVIVEENRRRVSWGKWGMASVRDADFRGIVSATMIYDDRPVLDHFRYVNENLVAGIMEGKALAKDGPFYFYLKR